MSARLIGTFDAGSPEWHAARAHGVGGSEIAAILGLSPWESRFSLWHRKAGMVGGVEETPEMEWGKRLEPVILQKYRDVHPDLDFEVINGTFCPTDRPWQIANPDLLAADRVVESKFSMFGDGWGADGTDEVPVHVRCQVLWYCDVVEREIADVVVLVGGCDWREYHVDYDADEARLLRERAEEFLGTVTAGVRPNIDAHSATYQVIKEMHPDIEDVEVVLANDTAHQYIEAKAAEKKATEAARLAAALVADEMGTAKKATWDGQTIATRQARGEGIPYVVAGRNLTDLITSREETAA